MKNLKKGKKIWIRIRYRYDSIIAKSCFSVISKGKLNRQDLIDHWCRVNQESPEHFEVYKKKIFILWKLRDKFEWNIIDPYGTLILDGIELKSLLQFIASKI